MLVLGCDLLLVAVFLVGVMVRRLDARKLQASAPRPRDYCVHLRGLGRSMSTTNGVRQAVMVSGLPCDIKKGGWMDNPL